MMCHKRLYVRFHFGVGQLPLSWTSWIKFIVILFCFIYCPIHSLYTHT